MILVPKIKIYVKIYIFFFADVDTNEEYVVDVELFSDNSEETFHTCKYY